MNRRLINATELDCGDVSNTLNNARMMIGTLPRLGLHLASVGHNEVLMGALMSSVTVVGIAGSLSAPSMAKGSKYKPCLGSAIKRHTQ